MSRVLEIASQVGTPLGVICFIAAVFFLTIRELIKRNTFPKLTPRLSSSILKFIIHRFYILALLALIFGIFWSVLALLRANEGLPRQNPVKQSMNVSNVQGTNITIQQIVNPKPAAEDAATKLQPTNAFLMIQRTVKFYTNVIYYSDWARFSFFNDLVTGAMDFYYERPNRLHVILKARSQLLVTESNKLTVGLWALNDTVTIFIKELNEYKQWTNVCTLDLDLWNPRSDLLKGFVRAMFPAYRCLLMTPENKFYEKLRPRSRANINTASGECDIKWDGDIPAAKVGGGDVRQTPDYEVATAIRTDSNGMIQGSESDLRAALLFLNENEKLGKVPKIQGFIKFVLMSQTAKCVVVHTNCLPYSRVPAGMFEFVPTEEMKRLTDQQNFSITNLFHR